MTTVQRYQNPTIGQTVDLRLFTYNGNNLADVTVNQVDIYYLDRTFIHHDNPDGRRLVESYPGTSVTNEDVGTNLLEVSLQEKLYVIGNYYDIWNITTSTDMPNSNILQRFEIYPNLWYSTPIPVVFDFSFHLQPNKFRRGSVQYMLIEIIPNVPTAGDLRQYYENLAIVSNLSITIEQECGDCLPKERDLRIIVEDVCVDYREKRYGFYQLDTRELDCGIYMLTCKLKVGTNIFVSDRMAFQIYT